MTEDINQTNIIYADEYTLLQKPGMYHVSLLFLQFITGSYYITFLDVLFI